MNETRLALSRLGWSNELIDAFMEQTAEDGAVEATADEFATTTESREATISTMEPLICGTLIV